MSALQRRIGKRAELEVVALLDSEEAKAGGEEVAKFGRKQPKKVMAAMALLGVAMFDGYARGPGEFPDLFDRAQGTLADHPISNGRNSEERVEAIATFAGQAFQLSQHFQPLLIFGEGSVAYFDFRHNLPDIPFQEWPRFSASGWSQGAAREWDSGRIVVLGEAGMCTAQLRGEKQDPMGMNHPKAGENPQFCLNAVRWLTRVLP